jgi:hypothetical protein
VPGDDLGAEAAAIERALAARTDTEHEHARRANRVEE